jgi:flagellar biosynthesis protein
MNRNNSDKTKRLAAAALRYSPSEDAAPVLVARGRGELAARIIEKAREAGIPCKVEPELLELLLGLDIGERVPEELFTIVAEIFAWLYTIEHGGKST